MDAQQSALLDAISARQTCVDRPEGEGWLTASEIAAENVRRGKGPQSITAVKRQLVRLCHDGTVDRVRLPTPVTGGVRTFYRVKGMS